MSGTNPNLQFLHFHKVLHLEDHAADRLVVHEVVGTTDLAKTKALERGKLIFLVADGALDLRHTQRFLCLSHY